ncbi:LysR family transcriptional regulator [Xinfangfangia sp. CPCC 101601]|uniref:LysR family transcriptional regulator n=1 Tax=Pseudogemmobacter lacusdianii TaxID=3069608 RepID=A0ABU0W1Q2_9RHOB|nr:LysR family transcriptional regulator [Xinfangfangia sp. CPCC 101601]MDQ2067939.1 LysR family transcriptional regulator [Xinfangfangia sp. CPCC 101601]
MEYPDWTLRELWLFQQVMELGTVTAAADRLGLSQPAASRMLASFERKTGKLLFDRVGRNLLPTAAAQGVLQQANAVLSAANGPAVPPNLGPSVLRVGAPPFFAHGFIPEALGRFASLMPECQIRLEIRSTPVILDALNEEDLDIGITDTQQRSPNLVSINFRRARLYCFASPSTKLAQKAVAYPADLIDEKLVLLTRRHGSRAFIERQLLSEGATPREMLEASSGEAALWLAHHFKGVALMSTFPIIGYLPVPLVPVPFEPEFRYDAQFLMPRKIAPTATLRLFMKAVRDTAEAQNAFSQAVTPIR